jgi:rod shape-determining protein MreB and related proteins
MKKNYLSSTVPMAKGVKKKIYELLSNDIGIDLGTANTLVYIRGSGIVINEPSVVAVNQKTGTVVAVGSQAKRMLGRTPHHIVAVKPLVDGVISDFEVTEEMVTYLLNKAQKDSKKMLGPRVVVGVPSGITNVETRAVRDATRNAGAREVYIVEEPMAAAIGIRLPVLDPVGSMVIDIGGGTTDIAVISLAGVVTSKNLRIAGDKLNNDIISYIRSEFKILIGEKTAENIKIAIGAIIPGEAPLEASIKGRDLITGLPREVIITDSDIREATAQSIDTLIESSKEVLETTPPEIVADIMQRGIFLSGGGALIRGLDHLLEAHLKIPVYIADDPLTAVARGAGIILENLEAYKDVLIQNEDELPPKK